MVRGIIRKLLAPREVWSVAVYAQPQPYEPGQRLGDPVLLLDSRRLRRSAAQPHTQADPFGLAKDGALYLFLETMSARRPGQISAWRTTDLATFEPLGVVLAPPFHVSFPYVFEAEGETFMVPESEGAGEVALYRFTAFPRGLERVRALVEGPFADPHLLNHDGRWYLFATRDDALHLFSAASLDGAFLEHPNSPITDDRRYSRSGGAVLRVGGRLYRVAQDCARRYGENCHLVEIVDLSPAAYEERVAFENIFDLASGWNAKGAHHLAIVDFAGRSVILTDGRQDDLFVNRFLGAVLR